MLFTSKEVAFAACVSDHLQFMQDVRRHRLPIESRRHNGRNTYDLTSFAVSMVVGELREYGISLSNCGRLLSRIDLDELSHCIAKLHLDEIEELIVLVPQRDDYDEEFPTTVTSWDEVRHFGKEEGVNFIPIAIGDLLKAKTRGEW
nr:hypothetical protein 18 [Paracoccaceae bacterium]